MKAFVLILICISLLAIGCTTDETQSTVEELPQDEIVDLPEVEDEVLVVENTTNETLVLEDEEGNTFNEWAEPIVDSDPTYIITGYTTPAGDRYIINRISIETNTEIDETTYIEIMQFNTFGLYDYDETLDCGIVKDIFKRRNSAYGISEDNGTYTLCFSPPRDMYEYNDMSISIQNAYEEVLLNETISAPRLTRSTQIVQLYDSE